MHRMLLVRLGRRSWSWEERQWEQGSGAGKTRREEEGKLPVHQLSFPLTDPLLSVQTVPHEDLLSWLPLIALIVSVEWEIERKAGIIGNEHIYSHS